MENFESSLKRKTRHTFGISLDIALYDMLKAEARKNYRTLNQEIGMRLSKTFEKHKLGK